MLNECLTALQDELKEIAGFKQVLGPEVVHGDIRSNAPVYIDVAPKDLPAIVTNIKYGQIKRVGGRYEYHFRGDILVCVFDASLNVGTSNLFEKTFGENGVYKTLINTPVTVSNTVLRKYVEEAYPRDFNEEEDRDYYLCEVIPVKLELWLPVT